MKKKWSFAVIGVVAVLFAVTFTTASSLAGTPLYTVRMEQHSNNMNFLPTAVHGFTYTTENGYTLDYDVPKYCGGVVPLGTDATCFPTCLNTCPNTCDETCPNTCDYTCDTCEETCPFTCPITCWVSCYGTCFGETCDFCEPTSYDTCTGPQTCVRTCYPCPK